MRAPLVEAEQHGSIRVQDLTKVVMARSRLGLAEERLVPFEAARNITYADDRPCALHRISAVVLIQPVIYRPAFVDIDIHKGRPKDEGRSLKLGARLYSFLCLNPKTTTLLASRSCFPLLLHREKPRPSIGFDQVIFTDNVVPIKNAPSSVTR